MKIIIINGTPDIFLLIIYYFINLTYLSFIFILLIFIILLIFLLLFIYLLYIIIIYLYNIIIFIYKKLYIFIYNNLLYLYIYINYFNFILWWGSQLLFSIIIIIGTRISSYLSFIILFIWFLFNIYNLFYTIYYIVNTPSGFGPPPISISIGRGSLTPSGSPPGRGLYILLYN